MKHTANRALLTGLISLVFVLTGCSGQDDYTKATACNVPTDLISNVLGSKAFSTDDTAAELPIDGNISGAGGYVCRVDVDEEKAFSVGIQIESKSTLDWIQAAIDRSPNPFTTEGVGQGKVDAPKGDDKDLYAQWICGDVGMTLEGKTKEQASVKDVTAVMKAWAKQAGCWSQEKFPADASAS